MLVSKCIYNQWYGRHLSPELFSISEVFSSRYITNSYINKDIVHDYMSKGTS